MTQEQNSLS